MQSAVLLVLIYLGLVMKVAALGRAMVSRLWPGRLFFCAMVILSLVRSAVAVAAKSHVQLYFEFWNATQTPLAVLEASAAIEAFWRLALHFRNIRRFGLRLMWIIILVAASASAAVSLLRVNWNGPLSGPLLISQCTQLGLLLTTLLSLAFFRQFPNVPIRPNAIRHLLVLSTLSLFFFVGRAIGYASGGEWKFVSNFVITLGAVLAFGAWTLLMKREGESLPFEPGPPMSIAEFEAAEAADTKANQELKRASSEAIRKLRR